MSAQNADKIATYFGVTVGYLLGSEQEKTPVRKDERGLSDKELMFALWGDTPEIDEDDLADVRRYAEFVRERKRKK